MKKDQSLTFRCQEDIKNKLLEIAEREDRSLSYIINRIIEDYLRNIKREP